MTGSGGIQQRALSSGGQTVSAPEARRPALGASVAGEPSPRDACILCAVERESRGL
ncbi:hypothetical protein MY11210_006101, partial [Beauveria gryllotalpidicola]